MDLSSIESWVFDLDNTLYPPEEKIFDQMDRKMTSFISEHLKIDKNEAFNIQKNYFLEYGTTLAGLMHDRENNVDPDEFLKFVHDIELQSLNSDPELRNTILGLPGTKFIFTNGTTAHAENVLKKLELENIFESIFDIRAANYIPKPNLEAYNLFIKSTNINPHSSIMFEDMGRNLPPAKSLGMTTVLIKRNIPNSRNVLQEKKYANLWSQDVDADYIIDDLVKFLNNR